MITIDTKSAMVHVGEGSDRKSYPFASAEAFNAVSKAYLRVGWDTKYVYGFTWLGRPIIQLPDDMIRLQEVIYRIQPDVIIETGIAHGGSLIYSASLCRMIGKGRVVGVDVEIRPHNRKAVEAHAMAPLITMIEGSSVAPEIVKQVGDLVKPGESTLIFLDSNHTYQHVLDELEAYASMVSKGSYIVAMDGIMQDVVGAPRTSPDWVTNNPQTAVKEFLAKRPEFVLEEPPIPFNEGLAVDRVTYWPNAYLKRI